MAKWKRHCRAFLAGSCRHALLLRAIAGASDAAAASNQNLCLTMSGKGDSQEKLKRGFNHGPSTERGLVGHAAGRYRHLLTLLKARIYIAEEAAWLQHIKHSWPREHPLNCCSRATNWSLMNRRQWAEAPVPRLAAELGPEPCFCMASFTCFWSRDENIGNSLLSLNQQEQGCVRQTVEWLLLYSLYVVTAQKLWCRK